MISPTAKKRKSVDLSLAAPTKIKMLPLPPARSIPGLLYGEYLAGRHSVFISRLGKGQHSLHVLLPLELVHVDKIQGLRDAVGVRVHLFSNGDHP